MRPAQERLVEGALMQVVGPKNGQIKVRQLFQREPLLLKPEQLSIAQLPFSLERESRVVTVWIQRALCLLFACSRLRDFGEVGPGNLRITHRYDTGKLMEGLECQA